LLAYHEDRVIQLSDHSVIDSSDSEGNGFHNLSDEEPSQSKIDSIQTKFDKCVSKDIENAINFSVI